MGVRSVWRSLAHWQIDPTSYFFLVICVTAQIATVLITWPLWEIRSSPINLPWVPGLPQIPFGILLIASLAGVLISPKKFGLAIHLAVLTAALLTDQMRCQPQVLWVAILTITCVWKPTQPLCVWALVSLWLWAGIHKLISAEWFGSNSLLLLQQAGIPYSIDWCYWFALMIALSEIAQGLLAIARPRIAALTCAMLHLGITAFMLLIQWNYSVVPWNICTAVVGTWLMRQSAPANSFLKVAGFTPTSTRTARPSSRWLGSIAVAGLLLIPLGVYTGHVRHCFAHILYSGGLPLANISKLDGTVEPLEGWETTHVPFPHEPKAYLDYFSATGAAGEKMHIHEMRPWLKSHYYLIDNNGQVQEISEHKFYDPQNSIAGIGCDDRLAIFELTNQGALMKRRTANSMIFAIQFSQELFSSHSLDSVTKLPNLEEIQLQDCAVYDEDLKKIASLKKLQAIGLNDTPITIRGLRHLASIGSLEFIEFKNQIYGSIQEIENTFDATP